MIETAFVILSMHDITEYTVFKYFLFLDKNNCTTGSFIPFRKKLTKEEIQSQNKRSRKKYPDISRRKDLTKEQRERGQKMRIRVKSYQKEILDPLRKSLPLLQN
ncbi:hypothetical protein LOD99_1262 [Oopsacas minuta]|uniref:Uncharacterized protein n=1 Tax=Oopsacas minuta TaxID=111878 RepID=A0AAV7K5H4_9METZ|nr:hypothetical protein LOD99_1262 [Oopsacas minuta]